MLITRRRVLTYLGAAFIGGATGRIAAEAIPETIGNNLAGLYHAKGTFTDVPRETLNDITTKVIKEKPHKVAIATGAGAVAATALWDVMAPK